MRDTQCVSIDRKLKQPEQSIEQDCKRKVRGHSISPTSQRHRPHIANCARSGRWRRQARRRSVQVLVQQLFKRRVAVQDGKLLILLNPL